MSYKIGQFRKDSLSSSDYLTSFSYNIIPVNINTDVSTQLGGFTIFTDYAVRLANSQFQYGNSYYVKLGIKRAERDQTVIISLSNYQNQSYLSDNSQILDTIVIPAQDNSINETAIIELAFSPNAAYSQILLTLQRTAYDYTIENSQGTSGRLIQIDENQVMTAQIYNVLNRLGDVNALTKIGVQGPPGLLMCINGEPIRIGPSGIYEIKNDYKITSMGFVVRPPENNSGNNEDNNKRDYFILDYQYKEA